MKALVLLGKAQESLIKKIISNSKERCVVFSVYATDIEGAIYIGGKHWLLNYFKISRLLKECVNSESLYLYTPHFVSFIPNILYFRSRKVRVFLLYDGILNFRNASWNIPSLRKVIAFNRIKSLFYFHVFRRIGSKINDESMSCVQGGVFPICLSNQNFDFKKQISFISEDPKIPVDLDSKTAMILEPVLHSRSDMEFLACYLKTFCLSKSIKKILLKSHPKFKKNVFLEFLRDSFEVVSLVGDIAPAEEIFFKYRPKFVLGDYSSALLNIKSQSSDVIAYSYGPLLQVASPDLESVIEVMKRQGVIFIERD